MQQSYHSDPLHVYFKDIQLVFTSNPAPYADDPDTLLVPVHSPQAIREAMEYIENMPMHTRVVFHNGSAEQLMAQFKALFSEARHLLAGGGVVFDENGRLLVIYRNRRWDLPKGKKEPHETVEQAAVRETQEETGLKSLRMLGPFMRTYHYYYREGERILKETHWFEMEGTAREPLIPAQHEGIEKVQWVPVEELPALYSSTYANLLQVFERVLQKHAPQPDEVADSAE